MFGYVRERGGTWCLVRGGGRGVWGGARGAWCVGGGELGNQVLMWTCLLGLVMWYRIHGHVVRYSWPCGTVVMVMRYHSHGHAALYSWPCGTIVMTMLYLSHCHVVPLSLPCGTLVIAMWYLSHCHAESWPPLLLASPHLERGQRVVKAAPSHHTPLPVQGC